jgi:hypothetical protein
VPMKRAYAPGTDVCSNNLLRPSLTRPTLTDRAIAR